MENSGFIGRLAGRDCRPTDEAPQALGCRLRCAGARCCTTRRGNAHRTDTAENREVLYPWHPWAGCIVLVQEVIEKADGVVLRCSRDSGATGRWLELPAWMFDRVACLPMQLARRPCVDFAALSRLSALLAETAGCDGRISSSNTPDQLRSADMANAPRRNASGSDRPHGAASPRTRPRPSSDPDGGGR